MIIWGKVIGALVGGILYGQLGVVIGLIVGQVLDNGLFSAMNATNHSSTVRSMFFKTVFQVMGHIAKVKGYVSENEVKIAQDIMLNDFRLNAEQMVLAVRYFTEGKQADFDFAAALDNFATVCGKYNDLRMFFLELQIKAAMANKIIDESLIEKLIFICTSLGIPEAELEYQLQAYGYSTHQQRTSTRKTTRERFYSKDTNDDTPSSAAENDPLSSAYKLLGVSPNDNMKTVKSAYRRLVSKYHPDKLFAKGLPPEMMTIAKEKTQQIIVAYDLIVRSRK